jgi:hypothetical protein
MDLYRIIRELVQERDRLQRIIESLEEMQPNPRTPVRPEAGGKRRGRKSMDIAARREVSERMKKYWAQRKAKRGAHSADHAKENGQGSEAGV